jgi:hypothetical protein
MKNVLLAKKYNVIKRQVINKNIFAKNNNIIAIKSVV